MTYGARLFGRTDKSQVKAKLKYEDPPGVARFTGLASK
jgi:hypothetical protein